MEGRQGVAWPSPEPIRCGPLCNFSQPSCQVLAGKGARAPGQSCTKVGEMEVPQLCPTLCSWDSNCCDCAPQALGTGAAWLIHQRGPGRASKPPQHILVTGWLCSWGAGCVPNRTPRQALPLPHPQVLFLPPLPSSSLSPSLKTLPLLLQQQRNQLSATPHPTVHSLLRC